MTTNDWLNSVQNFLFPPTCVLCGLPGHNNLSLCRHCLSELPYSNTACIRCAYPLTGNDHVLCGHCLTTPYAFERCYATFNYIEPMTHLIQGLKFNKKLDLALLLGELMADNIARLMQNRPDVIIPVPLHPSRLRERGFNQALELSRPIARKLRLPIDFQCCKRSRNTRVQSSLPASERHLNVRGAFIVDKNIKARSVAIVDDVMTTANTMDEITKGLLKAGVESVEAWVCARAV